MFRSNCRNKNNPAKICPVKLLYVLLVVSLCNITFVFSAGANAIGDVSGDGEVTAGDARLALRASVGLENYEPESEEGIAADATRDGMLTAEDARLILRAAVGLGELKEKEAGSYKIAFFGDSITAGVATTKTYHEYIHDIYGFTCYNYGYGGAGFVQSYPGVGGRHGTGNEGIGVPTTDENQLTPNTVVGMLERFAKKNTESENPNPLTYPDAVDAVVIFAGTNDWSHANTVSLADFAAAVDDTFTYYYNNFGDIPLLVVTPIHRLGDTLPADQTLADYVDVLIEKCREYAIPCVDAFTMSGLQPNDANNDTEFFSDNHIHPNRKGHLRIMRIMGETLNQLVKWKDSAEH